MKQPWKLRLIKYALYLASYVMVGLTMLCLCAWLEIKVLPFSDGASWKQNIAWMAILLAFASCYKSCADGILRIFEPPPLSPHGPDLYSVTRAEIEAERDLK